MYAGTTLRNKSGHAIGVHQRIDRLARRTLPVALAKNAGFPLIREILHFEGNNGPDGVKRKSPGRDEPWHEINPDDPQDSALFDQVEAHRKNLVAALQDANRERAAFEAAWLAHAITDGLTPAHQYPLSAKIEELWGKPSAERIGLRDKIFIKGDTKRQTLSKNWQYWGNKGVFTTHYLYEWGVAASIATYKFPPLEIGVDYLALMRSEGFIAAFRKAVQEVYALDQYQKFWKNGWTPSLARTTRKKLIPLIAETVALAWLSALEEAK